MCTNAYLCLRVCVHERAACFLVWRLENMLYIFARCQPATGAPWLKQTWLTFVIHLNYLNEIKTEHTHTHTVHTVHRVTLMPLVQYLCHGNTTHQKANMTGSCYYNNANAHGKVTHRSWAICALTACSVSISNYPLTHVFSSTETGSRAEVSRSHCRSQRARNRSCRLTNQSDRRLENRAHCSSISAFIVQRFRVIAWFRHHLLTPLMQKSVDLQ